MIVRYEQESGDISGIFPAEHWEGHLPEGHLYIELVLDEAEQSSLGSLMESPESYVVRDDGNGPALYEKGVEGGA